MGGSVPVIGVQLNGAVVTASHALPEGAAFADSQPVTLTLRQGLNALRLVRPASAGQWTIESLSVTQGGTPVATNYTAMWWNPAESGWGVNVTHNGDRLFITLFTYAPDGRDLWIVGSDLPRQADGSYTGEIHRATGPAFNASPWTGFALTRVGTMTFRFSGADRGTVNYTFNGTPVSKSIEKYAFGSPPTCTSASGSRAAERNYQDMWWNPAEPGWGINVTHQGDVIFATLFNYAPDGRDLWLVASLLARQSEGRYSGAIHRATGPAFNASPWGAVTLTEAGTMTLAFSDGENGTLAYSFNGVPVSKPIRRYVFDATAPVCR
jgi:hypothetical protein